MSSPMFFIGWANSTRCIVDRRSTVINLKRRNAMNPRLKVVSLSNQVWFCTNKELLERMIVSVKETVQLVEIYKIICKRRLLEINASLKTKIQHLGYVNKLLDHRKIWQKDSKILQSPAGSKASVIGDKKMLYEITKTTVVIID